MGYLPMAARTAAQGLWRPWLALSLTLWVPFTYGAQSPTQVVESLQNALVEAMKAGKEVGYAGRYAKLAPVIEATHDLPFIAQVAVGRYWKDLSESQRTELVDTFSKLSISTYADRFDSYSGETFKITGDKTLSGGNALIQAVLTDADGAEHHFDYLLHDTDKGWRIINIVVDGVSDLALKRAEYTATLKDRGFDALIATLKQKIGQDSGKPQP